MLSLKIPSALRQGWWHYPLLSSKTLLSLSSSEVKPSLNQLLDTKRTGD